MIRGEITQDKVASEGVPGRVGTMHTTPARFVHEEGESFPQRCAILPYAADRDEQAYGPALDSELVDGNEDFLQQTIAGPRKFDAGVLARFKRDGSRFHS